jgi:thiamine-phosphate pyrophosphorylase
MVVEEAVGLEDARCRFLVSLEGTCSPALAAALAELAAADRLAGLIAAAEPAAIGLAAGLPAALLAPAGGRGGDGAVVDARDAAAAAVAEWRRGDPDGILVADVATSRHAAMEAGEAGADALLFTGAAAAVRDCVAWWSELFVLPVAAPAADDELDELVAAGADFLVVDATRLVEPAAPLPVLLDRLAAAEAARPDRPPA